MQADGDSPTGNIGKNQSDYEDLLAKYRRLKDKNKVPSKSRKRLQDESGKEKQKLSDECDSLMKTNVDLQRKLSAVELQVSNFERYRDSYNHGKLEGQIVLLKEQIAREGDQKIANVMKIGGLEAQLEHYKTQLADKNSTSTTESHRVNQSTINRLQTELQSANDKLVKYTGIAEVVKEWEEGYHKYKGQYTKARDDLDASETRNKKLQCDLEESQSLVKRLTENLDYMYKMHKKAQLNVEVGSKIITEVAKDSDISATQSVTTEDKTASQVTHSRDQHTYEAHTTSPPPKKRTSSYDYIPRTPEARSTSPTPRMTEPNSVRPKEPIPKANESIEFSTSPTYEPPTEADCNINSMVDSNVDRNTASPQTSRSTSPRGSLRNTRKRKRGGYSGESPASSFGQFPGSVSSRQHSLGVESDERYDGWLRCAGSAGGHIYETPHCDKTDDRIYFRISSVRNSRNHHLTRGTKVSYKVSLTNDGEEAIDIVVQHK